MNCRISVFALIVVLSTACSQSSKTTTNSNTASTSSEKSASAPIDEHQRAAMFAAQTQITESLFQNGFCDVRVTVRQGELVLSGYTDTDLDKAMAEEMAKRQAHGFEVRNEIRLSGRPPVNINKRGGPKVKCS